MAIMGSVKTPLPIKMLVELDRWVGFNKLAKERGLYPVWIISSSAISARSKPRYDTCHPVIKEFIAANPDADSWMEIPKGFIQALHDRGMIDYHSGLGGGKEDLCKKYNLAKSEKVSRPNYFAWYDQPQSLNKAALDAWAAGQDRIAEYRAEEAAKTVRTAVLKRGDGQPGVGPLVEVSRSTDKRHYVRIIASVMDKWGKQDWFVDRIVQGSKPNMYCSTSDVLYWDVTPERYAKMKAVSADLHSSITVSNNQMEAELNEIRLRYQQRRDQRMAQFEDEMREVLGD